jgi:hypothetical protein
VASPAIYRSNRRGARPPMHSITTPTAGSSRTKSTTGAAISLGVEPPPGTRQAPSAYGSLAPRAGGSSPLPQDAPRSWSRGCWSDPLAVEADGIPAASSSPPCEKGPGISAHLPAHVSNFDHRWSRYENDREPTTGNYGYPPTSIARRRSPSASRSLRRHYPKQVPAASVPSNALSARCPSSHVCERTLADLDAGPI